MTDSIEQFIESLHLGCNFIATASLSGSAGDQAIPALAETAADDPAITLVDIGQDHIKLLGVDPCQRQRFSIPRLTAHEGRAGQREERGPLLNRAHWFSQRDGSG